MPNERENSDELLEKGGAFQISREKLQGLRAKFNQIQQKQVHKIIIPTPSSQPPVEENLSSQLNLSKTGMLSKNNIVPETRLHGHTLAPQANINAESTKIRFTLAKETSVLQTHPNESTGKLGNSSKIIVTQPPGEVQQKNMCNQQLPMILDVSQNILEKILYEVRRIAPELDLPHYLHKCLKYLGNEANDLDKKDEKIYKNLFEVLQQKIYVTVLFQNQEQQWSNLSIRVEDMLMLQQQPCKILYFLLRLISLFLHSIQHKLTKEQSTILSLKILQIIENVTNFLKKGKRICSLKAMYHFARHSPLSKEFVCHSCTEDQMPASIREDIFNVQAPSESSQPSDSSAKIAAVVPTSVPSSATSSSVFHGDLAYINISQILQILNMQRKTGCLMIKGKETIKIFLNQGMVVHAQTDTLTGEEAFYQVLLLERGYFAFVLETPSQTTMNYPIEFLLMEGSRRMDEQKRDQNT